MFVNSIMTQYTEKKCPKCGQQLRVPKDIGGMLMACPSCGEEFHSDFKLGGVRKELKQGVFAKVFGMPCELVNRISRFLTSK